MNSKLPCLILACVPCFATADQFGDFTFTDNGTSVTITDYPESATGTVTIPPSINGKPVTVIGASAFDYCKYITGVVIPDSVTIIGSNAFRLCERLSSVKIGNGVTRIDLGAFSGLAHLESIIIPDSVTTIDYGAFNGCQSLTYVKLGNQVSTIGQSAFIASAVTSIIFPASVKSIGKTAFYQGHLMWASFQGSPPTIGDQAFYMQPPGFKVYYDPAISGYTSPSWEGLPSAPGVPASITSAPPPGRCVSGAEYGHNFTATGTPNPVFVVTDGALPPNMWLSLAGRLSGYPTESGIFTATVAALNGFGPAASQTFTIDTNDYRMVNVTAANGAVQGAGEHLLNATATLTATPSPGYLFTGWTGDASGSDNPLSVLMNSDKNIGATFAPDTNDDDGDGWSNHEEIVIRGTNPAVQDSDGDSVNDPEDAFPLNPAETLDTDNDGTGDNADTDDDGDGYTDDDEINIHGTNPKRADSDGDGLTDPAELQTHHTNPNVADSDNDGLSDGAEINTHGTLPLIADTDGDGFLDGYEFYTGKSPTNDQDKPALVAEARTAIEFTFPAAIGKTYRIEASTNLEAWATVESGIAGHGGQVQRFYSTRGLPKRYFRVEEDAP